MAFTIIGSLNAATLTTDQLDYPPYSDVNIEGTGWAPGEVVSLRIDEIFPDGSRTFVWAANPSPVADATGSFTASWYIPSEDFIGSTLEVTANGPETGTLTTVFTDSAGAYTLKWYSSDPDINTGPYPFTYLRYLGKTIPVPGVGRADGRIWLENSVAYGDIGAVDPDPDNTSQVDAVTSLAPELMTLGQVVPFQMVISVNGDTQPENGTITFTVAWDTKTGAGSDFGFDPTVTGDVFGEGTGIRTAFVDIGDSGTSDSGDPAYVDSYVATIVDAGDDKTERIVGTFQVSGLDSGDRVVVEIWVALKEQLPAKVSGNVGTGLVSAETVADPPDEIGGGVQNVPLLQPGNIPTTQVDVVVTKSAITEPELVCPFSPFDLTYEVVVSNQACGTAFSAGISGLVLEDTLPSGLDLSSMEVRKDGILLDSSTYSLVSNVFTYPVSTGSFGLDPDASTTFTFFIPSVTTASCGVTFENTATVTQEFGEDCDPTNNTSTVTTLVDDSIPPTIECPEPIFLLCGADVPDPNTMLPVASDNCGPVVVTWGGDVADPDEESCPRTITRTYIATDACGNTAQCTQIISVGDPSVVTLGDFGVEVNGDQVSVWWETATEFETLGFLLYRWDGSDWEEVSDGLIPAQGWLNGGMGARYEVADPAPSADGRYVYRLEEVSVDGTTQSTSSKELSPLQLGDGELRITSIELATGGVAVKWVSREGERYRVMRSFDLETFTPVATQIVASPPENVFVDPIQEKSPVFYRIELE